MVDASQLGECLEIFQPFLCFLTVSLLSPFNIDGNNDESLMTTVCNMFVSIRFISSDSLTSVDEQEALSVSILLLSASS